ncbi:hypothetical protein GOBAR_DD09529 [Gossypium barbadense]|nr:hypothetical protein GOBAR_DD09529 [Gossypium barbadense]
MEREGRIHWKRWEVLIGAKVDGGLRFKGLKKFNDAMPAKQFWKMLQELEALWVKVLKGLYFLIVQLWSPIKFVGTLGKLIVFGTIERIKRAYQEVVGVLPFKVGREYYVVGSESVERCSPLDTRWVKVNSDDAVLKNGEVGSVTSLSWVKPIT